MINILWYYYSIQSLLQVFGALQNVIYLLQCVPVLLQYIVPTIGIWCSLECYLFTAKCSGTTLTYSPYYRYLVLSRTLFIYCNILWYYYFSIQSLLQVFGVLQNVIYLLQYALVLLQYIVPTIGSWCFLERYLFIAICSQKLFSNWQSGMGTQPEWQPSITSIVVPKSCFVCLKITKRNLHPKLGSCSYLCHS